MMTRIGAKTEKAVSRERTVGFVRKIKKNEMVVLFETYTLQTSGASHEEAHIWFLSTLEYAFACFPTTFFLPIMEFSP